MSKVGFLTIVAAIVVSGCAGRTSAPIQTTQVGDHVLSCNQLQAELSKNEQQARTLLEQHKKASDGNVAIGVVGAILFWPALFALDTGTAEKEEARALESRNSHLTSILAQKNCASEASAQAGTPTIVTAPYGTLQDRLMRLQSMRDQKLITEAEYNAQRADIVKQL